MLLTIYQQDNTKKLHCLNIRQLGYPEDFVPRGLSCGFVKVNRQFKSGDIVVLTDGKRKIKV